MSEGSDRKKIIYYDIDDDTDWPIIQPDGSFGFMGYTGVFKHIEDFSIHEEDLGIVLSFKEYRDDVLNFGFKDKKIARRIFLKFAKNMVKFKQWERSYYE